MSDIIIRRAGAEDASVLISLITSLAEFENLPPPNPEDVNRFIEHGFGPNPKYEAWLAEIPGETGSGNLKAIGYALVFETYSTFLLRPTMFLEDLFVAPAYRGQGAGKLLLDRCVKLAFERGCGRMEWNCLDWNKKAQNVYEKMGAKHLSDWQLYRLTRGDMAKIIENN